jgi:hypothetical protein
VEARAHELRAKARRNRAIVSALALAVVVAAVAGIVATRPDKHQVIVTDPSSTTAAPTTHPSIDGRFIPPTTTENGFVVLPVTFPDGETTTLRYPPEMKIAQLGFAGDVGVEYPVTNGALRCCSRVVSIRYATVAQVYGDAQPVKVYRGANGEAVDYFHASQAVDPVNATKQDYLVFQFGPWLVQVYDVQQSGDFELRMTDAERATWARSLTGTLDANGYLVLHAQAPLSIPHDQGQESGFGSEPGNVVELDPHLYCNEPGSDTNVRRKGSSADGRHGVSWCVAKELHVSAHGTARFAELAATQLEVSPLGTLLTAPPTSTTTTTTTATPTNAPAVSASFVSPEHGWVLQKSGEVAETTDGGKSWSAVGSLRMPASDIRIRFADAAHGYAFQSGGGLFATDDGGAHWSRLHTPTGVTDLAISHGSIYAVTWAPQGELSFRIWSAPVDHPAWTRDPLALQVGAGPVPSQQIVLAGGHGWILNVDRTVISGAELTANGTWSNWKPPCLDVNGPGFLSASTPTDLVAACEEGVWGGSKITPAVYFSHDGGATFQRRVAPISGAVASPDPNTAVIVDSDSIQRTTDGGATWHSVYSGHEERFPSDLGFTTPTQGFVISGGGQMLMTYDAGARWSAVALP